MSVVDKDLMFLAEFLEQYYIIPYTHDELLEILARIKNGYFLTQSEYETLKSIILGDGNIEGDFLFSGDYKDLINKPYIPKRLSDMADYQTFMAVINNTWAALRDKDAELEERITDNARFVSALEVVLSQDIQRLERLIDACKLFEGENLDDVIANIRGELGWLEIIRDDIEKGKVLSEKDFTAAYEEILKSINETTEGLTGYIKKVIAESIVDPGSPNGNGTFRLDSIGEALATKVDKVYGYGLSQNDFANKYKEMLDEVLNRDTNGHGTLQDYIIEIVDRYEEEFQYMINDLGDRMVEYTENEIQAMKKYMSDELNEMRDEMEATKQETLFGVTFKEGDGPASVALGGLKKGARLEGRSIREVLLDMLCPFVAPSASATLELSPHCDYLARIGDVVEVRGIKVSIDRGSLPINRVIFKQKIGSSYEALGAYDNSVSGHWFPEILELTKSIDSDYFVVEIQDTEGNSYIANTQAINIVYPIFYGAIGENEEPTTELVNGMAEILRYSGTDCTLRYTTNNERMVFAIPQGYGIVADVFDQNGYIITKSFKTKTITMSFEVKEVAGDIIQTNVYKQNYFVYYNNPSTVTGFEITYKF
jgi:hypothetical protein